MDAESPPRLRRLALGVSYQGQGFRGWQRQSSGLGVQNALEAALSQFAQHPVHTVCAGRTDAGVHAFNQVVHFDTPLDRPDVSWVRGSNRYLPRGVAVQWCRTVTPEFHARYLARMRRYRYVLLQSPIRPALDAGRVGWVFRPLCGSALREAAQHLVGEHDFSSFRSSECQAKSPIKTLYQIELDRVGDYWVFEFVGSAFLHHMVRNIMGCLLTVGQGLRAPDWVAQVRDQKNRAMAAPTFMPDGLYFVGPDYDAHWDLPRTVPGMMGLPHLGPFTLAR